jgi:magnesium/cobalt transport protein CorA
VVGFQRGPDGRCRPWDGFAPLAPGARAWLSLRLDERGALASVLDGLGVGRVRPFIDGAWRHPLGRVADDALLLLLEAVDSSREELKGRYLLLVLTPDVLVSVLPDDTTAARDLEQDPERALADGLDYLVFQLLTPLLDAYESHSEALVARAEALEADVLHGRRSLYTEIFVARREALRLRRVIEPELDVLALLVDHRFRGEAVESPYFQDLYRRLRRIAKEVESVRDGLAAMVESYASVVANEMNRVMKFLTVLSTVFLPATLIASIYGMNFRIPEYGWPHGYAYSLGVMVAVSGLLVAYIAAKGWFR